MKTRCCPGTEQEICMIRTAYAKKFEAFGVAIRRDMWNKKWKMTYEDMLYQFINDDDDATRKE